MLSFIHDHHKIFSILWMMATISMLIILIRTSGIENERVGVKVMIICLSLLLSVLWPVSVAFFIGEELIKLYARLWNRIKSYRRSIVGRRITRQ